MNAIPEEFHIIKSRYLFSGWGVEKWEGQTSAVFSTISSREKYEPTILGSIPFMGEKKA
jgi:glyceraldehyde-3-phosphate dehydrogenase (NADP+)